MKVTVHWLRLIIVFTSHFECLYVGDEISILMRIRARMKNNTFGQTSSQEDNK